MLTISDLKEALPQHLHSAATQDLADKVNQIATDEEYARTIRENFVTYAKIMADGKFKPEDYLNAVAYVSYKMMGYNNKEAYARTFPDRYANLVGAGRTDKEISSYVAAYHKNKLVNMIMEQSLIPTWILNQDVYQRAINTQVEIMTNPNTSDKVRCEAADSLLNHLKRPEVKKVQLDIGVTETSGMAEMRQLMEDMAEQQKQLIASGAGVQAIAHQRIIPGIAVAINDTP